MKLRLNQQRQKRLVECLARRQANLQISLSENPLSKPPISVEVKQREEPLHHSNKIKQKRFTTTGDREGFEIDFRLKTFYKPNNEYKFTGSCYRKTFFRSKKSSISRSKTEAVQHSPENTECQRKYRPEQQVKFSTRDVTNSLQNIVPQSVSEENQTAFESTIKEISSPSCEKEEKKQENDNSPQRKYRFSNPAPARQEQFFVLAKRTFVAKQKQRLKKMSIENRCITNNVIKDIKNLISFEDFINEKKQSFKRSMECELIRVGETKLLNQVKLEKKGKVYLKGLHKKGSKQKRIKTESLDVLHQEKMTINPERKQFSTPNILIRKKSMPQNKMKKHSFTDKNKERTNLEEIRELKSLE